MKDIYSWENIHQIIDWIENYCKEHPKITVDYKVKISGNYASIDIGIEHDYCNREKIEGNFCYSSFTKKQAICEVLYYFIHWYKKHDKIIDIADDFLENYITAKHSGLL